MNNSNQVEMRTVSAAGVELSVAVAGAGPAVVLLHGFPHTWRLWSEVMPQLAGRHRVIAPDMRGLGNSGRTADGFDAVTLASDVEAVLDALGEPTASIVAIDAGAPPAFLLALQRPERVRRLVLMESMLGTLPRAENFLAGGPPWWFGFHAVPGLAESVLVGHEAEYVDWFLSTGTRGRGVPKAIRDEFVSAYTGSESLRCAFAYYRAMPSSGRQIAEAVAVSRLTVPVMAIGAQPVGDVLAHQLRPVADDLESHVIEDCGHIIPLDRPEVLVPLLRSFLEADCTLLSRAQ